MKDDPRLRKRIDFDLDAPRDGTTVVLVMVIDDALEDMAEAHFVEGSWQFVDLPADCPWAMADFRWNGWFIPEPPKIDA